MNQNKKLKLGLTSSLLIIVVAGFLLVINILLSKSNIFIDLSQERIFSISDQTKSIINGLEQDIYIYILNSEDAFPIGYKQIVEQYAKESSHIKVVYRGLDLYPDFPSRYMDLSSESVTENSIIVACDDKHVYMDSNEYVTVEVQESGAGYDSVFGFEPLLTSAINTVNDGTTYKVYCTTGHNEKELLSSTRTGLIRDNYKVTDYEILSEDIPEDANIILINAPTSDFSTAECDKLKKYVEQGGALYYIVEASVDLTNLSNLTQDFGVQIEEGIVLEQDSSMIYGNTPTYIIPRIRENEITKSMYENQLPMLILISKGLTLQETSEYKVSGLLATSDYAYSKLDLDSAYVSREDDDIMGPFYLSALSENESGGKLLVLGSANVLNDDADELVYGNNTNFFLNGMNYLLGDIDKIAIRGKAIQDNYNMYTTKQVYIIGGIAILGIPVVILLIGFIVVIVRRKRSQQNINTDEAPISEESPEGASDEDSQENMKERAEDNTEENTQDNTEENVIESSEDNITE